MSTSVFVPLVFTGISTFSNDFQTVLTRAVAIASLPLKALQNQDADVVQKKALLGSLGTGASALGASVAALGTIAHNKALAASSSDSTKISVVDSGATVAATYSITVTSIAKAASETSKGFLNSTTTQVSSTGTLQLVIGSTSKPIVLTPASNNLVGLRDAINNLGVGVSASILTTGSGNYLSVSANNTGLTTLQLIDDPAPGANINLLTSANQGTSAVFNLNSVPVTKASNTVNDLVSGATFTILNTTAEPVTLSLATDRSQLQSAIQDLTTKYNSMVDQVDGQIGPSAGLLTGDSTLRDIQSTMRKLTSFQGSGSIRSLTDLGIQLGSDGKMTFDTKVFTALSDTQISSAFDFFGSPTTGFGGVSQDFTQITDPINGLIKLQQDGYDAADKRLQGSISDLNDRITQLQTRVSIQLQAADALQAQLTAQQQLLTASLAALTFTSFGKPVGS